MRRFVFRRTPALPALDGVRAVGSAGVRVVLALWDGDYQNLSKVEARFLCGTDDHGCRNACSGQSIGIPLYIIPNRHTVCSWM